MTLVGISYMQVECLRAQRYLESMGVHAEVIDPVWLAPLDIETIVTSARKTRRLCVVDNGWTTCGAGAEIVSSVAERLQGVTGLQVRRMGFAPVTCPPPPPPTPNLEQLYYPNARTIAAAAYDLAKGGANGWLPEEHLDLQEVEFKGPF